MLVNSTRRSIGSFRNYSRKLRNVRTYATKTPSVQLIIPNIHCEQETLVGDSTL